MEKINPTEKSWVSTARTLSEALPYIQRYDKAKIVIKLGGHAISNSDTLKSFARDIILMKQCNLNPIIVHGGGPMINTMLKKVGIASKFVDGKRVSTRDSIPIIEMVLSGKVNREIVSAINSQGGKAVGLSGKDANLLICEQDKPELEFVGKPTKVNSEILECFLDSDFIPIVSPIGVGKNGETYNINADTVSGAIAAHMKAERLLLLTDVSGVKDKTGQVLTKLTSGDIEDLTRNGTIVKGMLPKTQTATDAIKNGVRAVVILDGRAPNAILLELFTDLGAGTLIREHSKFQNTQ